MKYVIGTDIGGTFTDAACWDNHGSFYKGKAPTVPANRAEGVINAMESLRHNMGLSSTKELLSNCVLFIHGTTVVTNAIAELKGARVGLIVSRGFKDTLAIRRSLTPLDIDYEKWTNPPVLVPASWIKEVDERVDYSGKVVVPLNKTQVVEAVKDLVENHGVEAVAVCFLWSFMNSDHENMIRKIVKQKYPQITVHLSSDVFPVYREYERMVTTVFDAMCGKEVIEYTSKLNDKMGKHGLGVPIHFMNCGGGAVTKEEVLAIPCKLYGSGPVGGVIGANWLAEQLGIKNLITADLGGTSWDVACIHDNKIGMLYRTEIGGFPTGLAMVDLVSIGRGGGSILKIDERGLPAIGPESAGAIPGPICYGKGGTYPTVTDMELVLGILNKDFFLGGEIALDPDSSIASIKTLANKLGIDIYSAAESYRDVLVEDLANAVRMVSVRRGYDPAEFTLFAYGGGGPMFATDVCRKLGIEACIVSPLSAEFSAFGLTVTDHKVHAVRGLNWNFAVEKSPDRANKAFAELTADVEIRMKKGGFNIHDMILEGDFSFIGQTWELTMPIRKFPLSVEDLGVIPIEFLEAYEKHYGKGTAWVGSPIQMKNARVIGTASMQKPKLIKHEQGPLSPDYCFKGNRNIFSKGKWRATPTYALEALKPNAVIRGPALVEGMDTVVHVTHGVTLKVDNYRNCILRIG